MCLVKLTFCAKLYFLFYRTAHNNHRVRTENYQTPIQLWFSNVLENFNSDRTEVTNLFRNEGGEEGDDGGRDPYHRFEPTPPEQEAEEIENPNHLAVSPVINPLNDDLYSLLLDTIDPLAESQEHGIDIYVSVVSFLMHHLGPDRRSR